MTLAVICVDYSVNPDESITCNQMGYQESYLMPPEAMELSTLIMNGGVDLDALSIGFMGIIALWATGLTVGLIISMIRKLRNV